MYLKVGEESLAECWLLKKRTWWERLDILPFVAVHVVMMSLWAGAQSEEFQLVMIYLAWFVVAVVHAGALLGGFWSVPFRAKLRYKLSGALDATFACVVPKKHCGKPEICAIKRVAKKDNKESKTDKLNLDLPSVWFEFQREKFGWSGEEDDAVRKVDYPCDKALGAYLEWQGHDKNVDLVRATAKWGKNEFDIPFPSLRELFTEHALAPFFIFQVFCVALWCLDEYWYYSVFTLVMLVLFELTVCKQRQQSLSMLRNMRRPSFPVFVYRGMQWYRIMSSELVPGDICSIIRISTGRVEDDDQILMPCDVLLLHGSCIVNEAMLTGESVPKMKESIQTLVNSDNDFLACELNLQDAGQAQHVILGGTRVIQHAAVEEVETSKHKGQIPSPPDGGCICFVLRTGFGTSQGSLMRTILFSTERVTVDNVETYLFIAVLLVFAILASAYVMVEGLKNEKQSRWKLFLHCTMIITSVVPPELPMELSLAVNTSLARLHRLAIFCTEPYRIPFAGRLDVCCFDKTGTLTSDTYFVRGVMTDLKSVESLNDPQSLPDESTFVIAGCHQLVRLSNKVDGDPMEQASVRAIRWGMTRDGRMIRRDPGKSEKKEQLRIVHRHPFSAETKRMSAVVFVDKLEKESASDTLVPKPARLMVVCKGAPEVIEKLLGKVPDKYHEAYQSLMMTGARVLALAFKDLPLSTTLDSIRQLPREDAESRLKFAGFLALDCPLKDDTASAISQLQRSQHQIMVITGDNALTACDVARKLGIISESCEKTLTLNTSDKGLFWDCIDPSKPLDTPLTFSQSSVQALFEGGNHLVVTGQALEKIEQSVSGDSMLFLEELKHIAPYVTVFARVSPRHKEMLLAALKGSGLHCLMCGDGTNDVGALKQADVGVSIINSPEHEDAVRKARSELNQVFSKSSLEKMSAAERLRAELQMMERAEQGSSIVQLGDASIASPFTSRTTSIMSTVYIVRQGRCTLVTTIQMYKILALNCLISAYSLSALHLYGVKQGDTQSTLAGLLIAGLFMFISWAEPLEELSVERPESRIFSKRVISSLAGQLLIHFASLFAVLDITLPFVDAAAEEMQPDAEFKPNVINSAIFLVSLCMQCNVFGVNYRGLPFMQSLKDNKAFHRVLGATWLLCILMAVDVVPDLGEQFELVPIPEENDYKSKLVAILLANTAGSWAWEWLIRSLLG